MLVQKVPKNTLRGFAPKDSGFWNRVVERFILETMSVERVPTYPGTLPSPPAGLLCSGLQNRKVVASLFLMLFMVRWRLAGKGLVLPLPAAAGAVSGEKRLGYPSEQGLRPGRGRSGKAMSTRR